MANRLQSTLVSDLVFAYEMYAEELSSIGRNQASTKVEWTAHCLRAAAGRLGARVAAAVKREKRHAVIGVLLLARQRGLDITATAALRASERLLGRGLDKGVLGEFFWTPGRTAADKAVIITSDMVTLDAALDECLIPTLQRIERAKTLAHERWLVSTKRQTIDDEWFPRRPAADSTEVGRE